MNYPNNYNYYTNPYQQPGYGIPNQLQSQIYSNNNTLKGRPVSSLEEVKAAPVDFDGSLFVYPDIANNKIYTKKINVDGTSELKIYKLESDETPKVEYSTKEDLEKLKEELLSIINSKEVKIDAAPAAAPKLNF